MKKKYRVKKQTDFKAIFNQRNSTANRQFIVYQLDKENQQFFRVGLSVSKKLGNAVVRNHTKRYIRQILTEEKDSISVGKDYVIIARKPCVEMNYTDFKKSLIHVLKKAKVWQGK